MTTEHDAELASSWHSIAESRRVEAKHTPDSAQALTLLASAENARRIAESLSPTCHWCRGTEDVQRASYRNGPQGAYCETYLACANCRAKNPHGYRW